MSSEYSIGTVSNQGMVWDVNSLAWVKATQAGGGGGGAVTVADGADVTQGSMADAEAASGSGSVIAILKRLRTLLGGTIAVSLSSAPSTPVTNAGLTNLDVLLSSRTKPADQQHVIVDSSAAVAVTSTGLTNLDVLLSSRTKPADQQHVIIDSSAAIAVTTTPPTNASTNVAQFGGSNAATGTGVSGAGIPRVTVSSDSFPASVAVTGTFFQSTQPVSIAATVGTDPADRAARLLGHVTVDSGTVTANIAGSIGNTAFQANAGTNLNTSLLALDSTVAKDASLTTLHTDLNATLPRSVSNFPATQVISATTLELILQQLLLQTSLLRALLMQESNITGIPLDGSEFFDQTLQ